MLNTSGWQDRVLLQLVLRTPAARSRTKHRPDREKLFCFKKMRKNDSANRQAVKTLTPFLVAHGSLPQSSSRAQAVAQSTAQAVAQSTPRQSPVTLAQAQRPSFTQQRQRFQTIAQPREGSSCVQGMFGPCWPFLPGCSMLSCVCLMFSHLTFFSFVHSSSCQPTSLTSHSWSLQTKDSFSNCWHKRMSQQVRKSPGRLADCTLATYRWVSV
jgi:hypothetical protein